ncbi:MAG: hypothetical protein ACXWKP_35885 [Bradyrhizobium sp.]
MTKTLTGKVALVTGGSRGIVEEIGVVFLPRPGASFVTGTVPNVGFGA